MKNLLYIAGGFAFGALLLSSRKPRMGAPKSITVEFPEGFTMVEEKQIKHLQKKIRQLRKGYRAPDAVYYEPVQVIAPALPPKPMLALPPAQIPVSNRGGSSSALNVTDVPVNIIGLYLEKFQNREAAYSSESVARIMEAAHSGTFRFEELDPVLLWKAPDGKLYMLSGHSRLEAFKRLCAEGFEDFCAIPSKIISVSEAEAADIALRSNTLSTKEKDTERAMFYRKQLIAGRSYRDVIEAARKAEGSNANRIMAYAFLNPDGKAFVALKSLEAGDPTSQTIIKAIAQWIGEARMKFAMLTDMHENEMYDYLVNGAFGKVYKRKEDFLRKIAMVIQQRTTFGEFDSTASLNLYNAAAKNFSEHQYDNMVDELKQKLRDLDETIKAKTADYKSRGATSAQIYSLLQNDYAYKSRLSNELTVLLQRKSQIVNQPQTASLFGSRIAGYGNRYTGPRIYTALG